ncbi:MAG: putative polymerase ECF-subfamily sigma factor [Frankiales bacterium]|nr:putative polymerase ECF-subfamily sigma factor [Frankiales bacterium]
MTRASRDDEFRAYVVRSRSALVRTATLLTAGDAHLAEDLVQTALTRLYLAWPRVRPAEGPDSYTRRILANALIDERRRPYWRRERSHADVPEHASDVSIDEGPELHALLAALGELPAGMRAAVVFRHVHELSVAETARALGCSEGNVKSQTARGLDHLRARLTPNPMISRSPR